MLLQTFAATFDIIYGEAIFTGSSVFFFFFLNSLFPICPGLISPTVQHMDKHTELQI